MGLYHLQDSRQSDQGKRPEGTTQRLHSSTPTDLYNTIRVRIEKFDGSTFIRLGVKLPDITYACNSTVVEDPDRWRPGA
jgi:hypothetical protein